MRAWAISPVATTLLNGERYTLRATRVGNTWTIEEVDPAPPD